MQRNYTSARIARLCMVIVGLGVVLAGRSMPAGAAPTLDITVGSPTQLSTQQYSQGRLAVSRTGVVKIEGIEIMSVGLAEGGVVAMGIWSAPAGGGEPPATDYLESTRQFWSDDFSQVSTSTSTIFLPNAARQDRWGGGFWPIWDKGKMIQLDNGDLLANMYGDLLGDTQYRTMLMHSTDQGQSWQYRSTVAYSATDPNPELPGQYVGYCESSITLLANGQLLAMMRTQGSAFPPYRPMYVAWSDDLGLTWTEPEPTSPHLLNVSPTALTLDNGVVAVAYGRPGIHVAFSTDNGHSWSDIETFSTMGTEILGYADMVKVGPNELLMMAGIEGGTYTWPIRVDLAGDVNGDGFIGGDDLTVILENWGQSVTGREEGDLNGDLFVGGDDYSEVLTHWGTGVGLGAVLASVPEPTVLLLLSFAWAAVLSRRMPKRA